jgi:23S rRNA pseudouridine955/2504/2580 synthase
MSEQNNIIEIGEIEDGQRLDRWLKKKFPHLSFGDAQKILRTGQLRIDGKRAKGDARLAMGQTVRLPPQLFFEDAPLKKQKRVSEKDADMLKTLVLFEDAHLIAINKPAGIASQGGSKVGGGGGGMMLAMADKTGHKPHLVHRLDKDTTGVMLLAKNPKVARALGDMFKSRDMRKYYWAITAPAPEIYEGKIKSSLAKVKEGSTERVRAVDTEDGKMALTYYTVIETAGRDVALVAFWPRTGRMHQIRVHAAEMGCPLLGDFKYEPAQPLLAENPDLPDALHLHARRLIFSHPVTGKKIDITAPVGPEMKKTLKYFGFPADSKTDPFEDLE